MGSPSAEKPVEAFRGHAESVETLGAQAEEFAAAMPRLVAEGQQHQCYNRAGAVKLDDYLLDKEPACALEIMALADPRGRGDPEGCRQDAGTGGRYRLFNWTVYSEVV